MVLLHDGSCHDRLEVDHKQRNLKLIDDKKCHAKVAEAGGEPVTSHRLRLKQGYMIRYELVLQRR